jgi:hypothetical protein
MKKLLLILIVLLSNISYLSAQVNIQVVEEMKTMSLGERPAFVVDVPEGNYEIIKKAWIKLLENGTRSKAVLLSNEINIKGAVWQKISLDSINIYSSVYDIDSVIKVVSFIEIDSVFISSEPSDVYEKEIPSSIKTIVRDFAVNQYMGVYEEKIKNEESVLKDLEKEYQSLSDELEKNQKNIKENEENITQSENAIKITEADLELKDKEIEAKKLEIQPLKAQDPEAYKLGEKELNVLEKEKNKMENEREKEKKDIVTYQNNISEAERNIKQIEEEMEVKTEEIELQEDVIGTLEGEMSRIK